MIGVVLVLASLLSVGGQLCQKQATRPLTAGGRRRHLMLWLGLALICMGAAMVLWLLVLQTLPVGIAYPMLSLNFVWVTLAAGKSGMNRFRPPLVGRRIDYQRHYHSGECGIMGVMWGLISVAIASSPS